ncbi:uncharacterized protein LOC120488696 [Pimephales promelas]|uniref:uncharacterized protein LOC120488696 n=1 Tax=Pimephales promelas TaxID=90988 RepID=UPI0019558139|nr:uncharacterized protein LOC120488696 [Pimephales promelas]
MVNNMLSSEKPKEGVCHHCGHKAAVVMCRDCLPRSLYCTACDLSTHEALVLHNRASMVEGFFRHPPPSTFVQQDEGGKFSYYEKDCMLPIVPPCCDCSTGQTIFSRGKPVILVGMNGTYNLFLPSVNCSCGKTLPVTMSDLVESGYWPATVNFETLYMVDLFTTYEDLKITAPGMSRQAFVSMLKCVVQNSLGEVVRYVGTQCRGPSSNGPMPNLRLTSCLRSIIFSVLHAHPPCWQLQWMGTANYIVSKANQDQDLMGFLMESFWPVMLRCPPLLITSMEKLDIIQEKGDVVRVSGPQHESPPTSLRVN